jgi:hypothetical protein
LEPPEHSNTSGSSPEILSWKVRLLGDRSGFVFVIGAVAVAAGLIGIVVFRSPSMGLLGFAMILASTADYWLGSNFKLDARGASARVGLSLTAMEWANVKRVIVEPNAIKLSPLAEENRMDSFRGVILRTNSSVRNRALDLVRLYIPDGVTIKTEKKEFPR